MHWYMHHAYTQPSNLHILGDLYIWMHFLFSFYEWCSNFCLFKTKPSFQMSPLSDWLQRWGRWMLPQALANYVTPTKAPQSPAHFLLLTDTQPAFLKWTYPPSEYQTMYAMTTERDISQRLFLGNNECLLMKGIKKSQTIFSGTYYSSLKEIILFQYASHFSSISTSAVFATHIKAFLWRGKSRPPNICAYNGLRGWAFIKEAWQCKYWILTKGRWYLLIDRESRDGYLLSVCHPWSCY